MAPPRPCLSSVRAVGLHPVDIKVAASFEPPTTTAAATTTTAASTVPLTPRSPQPPKSTIRAPEPPATEDRLSGAVHLLRTEANALQTLAALYEANSTCRDGFSRAVDAVTRHRSSGGAGKVVFMGVGKSGLIAKKLVATFTSLGIPAVFLHPTEALHGDLGIVGDADTMVMITFSARTPELLHLLPHLNQTCPLVVLTAPMTMEGCAMARARPDLILLPAPIPEPEVQTFGVGAPTTSTTVALAVGDALAFVASQEMYPNVAGVFGKNHPGGAIGQTYKLLGR